MGSGELYKQWAISSRPGKKTSWVFFLAVFFEFYFSISFFPYLFLKYFIFWEQTGA